MATDHINNNLTVIIRTVGERTTDLCHLLLKKQVAAENIHLVQETPFTAAVKKTYELALQENRKWTFVIDADLLPASGIIAAMVAYAETLKENVFEIEGQVNDKFLESPRRAGNHLYRTRHMTEALKHIPRPTGALRPESMVLNKMSKKGYPWLATNFLVGLHDYEQYYLDIYRKSFTQAGKHRERVNKLLPLWQQKAQTDRDFKVALAGFQHGLLSKKPLSIDLALNDYFKNELDKMGISEKKALPPELLQAEGYTISTAEYLQHKNKRKAKAVIYTAISGPYDQLLKHSYISKDYDYVCYTDQPVADPGPWEIRPLETTKPTDRLTANYYKLFPDQLFKAYDYSIWLDGNVDILGPALETRVKQLIEKDVFLAAGIDAERNCFHEAANLAFQQREDDPELIFKLINYLKEQIYPQASGFYKTNILVRKHHHPALKKMMQDWWLLLNNFSSLDYLSFPYVLAKNDLHVEKLFAEDIALSKDFLYKPQNAIIYPALSIDSGQGYNAKEVIFNRIALSESGLFKAEFELEEEKEVKSLRFYPFQDQQGKLKLHRVLIKSGSTAEAIAIDKRKLSTNGTVLPDGSVVFIKQEPYCEIPLHRNISRIEISGEINLNAADYQGIRVLSRELIKQLLQRMAWLNNRITGL